MDEFVKVVIKTKKKLDMIKDHVFDSVKFVMMMREGEKSNKIHPNQQYQVTIKMLEKNQ
jgi:hypothetical protein